MALRRKLSLSKTTLYSEMVNRASMPPNLLGKIATETAKVDQKYQNLSSAQAAHQKIIYPVPHFHPRASKLSSYSLICRKLTARDFAHSSLIFIDHKISQEPWIKKLINKNAALITLKANEIEFEEIKSLNSSLQHIHSLRGSHITAMGGGSLLYAVGYIAEQWECDATYIPTTALSMSDTSIGGKVRIHRVKDAQYERHFYRSYYEPNHIIIDPRFLDDNLDHEVTLGLAEIIKHALYQSPALLQYLLSKEFEPFENKSSLMKAIMWTAALKRACLVADPYESEIGSNTILRAAHDISDQLEIESKLQMRHGKAVWRAIEIDLKDTEKAKAYQALAQKLWRN